MGKKDKQKSTYTLDDALFDVEARFLLPMSLDDIERSDRLFFQIEQAHWFYEDFIVEEHKYLPHFKLRDFSLELFEHCPMLTHLRPNFETLYDAFITHRYLIPVCGVIMLNKKMDRVVLVRNWKGSSWSFPKGKINEDEDTFDCAIREVFEETGFDATPYCNPSTSIVVKGDDQRTVTLYIATDVPEDTEFCPQTRKEISRVEFHALDKLPKNAWGVHGFLPQLLRWIAKQKKGKKKEKKEKNKPPPTPSKKRSASNSSKQSTNTFDNRSSDTFAADTNREKGWSVADMFAANAKLTGAEYTYDGNPHRFGDMHPRYTRYEALVSPLRVTSSNSTCDRDMSEISARTANAFGGIAENMTEEYFPICFQFDMNAIRRALIGAA